MGIEPTEPTFRGSDGNLHRDSRCRDPDGSAHWTIAVWGWARVSQDLFDWCIYWG